MARDRAKNAYFTMSLPLESDILRWLRADAEETGVSIPQLLAIRVADWYWFARQMQQTMPIQLSPLPEREKVPLSTHEQVGTNGNGLQMRASAAAAAWGGGEDE